MKILIVDDHDIFKRGLRSLLASRPDFEICGEASDGVEATVKAKQLQPDVVLMDISMPAMNGLQATRLIHEEVPQSKILILSQHDPGLMLTEALKAGASAYVNKSQTGLSLLELLDGIAKGQPLHWASDKACVEPAAKPALKS